MMLCGQLCVYYSIGTTEKLSLWIRVLEQTILLPDRTDFRGLPGIDPQPCFADMMDLSHPSQHRTVETLLNVQKRKGRDAAGADFDGGMGKARCCTDQMGDPCAAETAVTEDCDAFLAGFFNFIQQSLPDISKDARNSSDFSIICSTVFIRSVPVKSSKS